MHCDALHAAQNPARLPVARLWLLALLCIYLYIYAFVIAARHGLYVLLGQHHVMPFYFCTSLDLVLALQYFFVVQGAAPLLGSWSFLLFLSVSWYL